MAHWATPSRSRSVTWFPCLNAQWEFAKCQLRVQEREGAREHVTPNSCQHSICRRNRNGSETLAWLLRGELPVGP